MREGRGEPLSGGRLPAEGPGRRPCAAGAMLQVRQAGSKRDEPGGVSLGEQVYAPHMFAFMSKWFVQSWEDDYLEVEADRLVVRDDGALHFLVDEEPAIVLAHGTYQTVFAQDAGNIARRVAAPSFLDLSRNGLAAVVDIRSKGAVVE